MSATVVWPSVPHARVVVNKEVRGRRCGTTLVVFILMDESLIELEVAGR